MLQLYKQREICALNFVFLNYYERKIIEKINNYIISDNDLNFIHAKYSKVFLLIIGISVT